MINKTYLPTSASFLVSEDCNLACTYCFELDCRNTKSMSKEVARKGLEYLCENAIKNREDEFHAMLFGGEPLLEPDIVEEILKYGLELAKNNLRFTSSMVTNATILTDKIKYIIQKYKYDANLSVQLSVDGIKEVHDMYRVTKNGKGSFDLVEKNIEGWKELFSENINMLSIHGCCNKQSLPYLFENYKFFREKWNVPRLWFMPIHSEEWDPEDVDIYDKELTKIADYVLQRAKEDGNANEVLNYAPLDRCFSHDIRPNAPCGAGKNFVTITADGEIYPCHSFYFNDPESTTRIGNIWDGIDEPKRELFVKYGNEDISCAKECPDCDAYHCYRCIADNWTANGSILSQIRGERCEMSFVERKIHKRLRKELSKMGLFNDSVNNSNDDCRCNLGEPIGCDVVVDCDGNQRLLGSNSHGETKGCNCDNKKEDFEEVISEALKIILEKIDSIESIQTLLLKKLL